MEVPEWYRRPHPNTLDDLLAVNGVGPVADFWREGIGLAKTSYSCGPFGFPDDFPAHVFLCRALMVSGAAMFGPCDGDYVRTPAGARACGAGWSGYEPAIFECEPLPADQEAASPEDQRWATVVALTNGLEPVAPGQRFAPDAWSRLSAFSKDASRVSLQARRRVADAEDWLKVRLLDGRLACVSLDPVKCDQRCVSNAGWAFAESRFRFISGRVYTDDLYRRVADVNPPPGVPVRRDIKWWLHPGETAWLYVNANDLRRELATLLHAPSIGDPGKPDDDAPELVIDRPQTMMPKPSRSFAESDAPLVEKMQAAIEQRGISPHAAALELVDQAQGSGTTESRAKRLCRAFAAKYGMGATGV